MTQSISGHSCSSIRRRNFLSGAAAFGAMTLSGSALGADNVVTPKRTRYIDVHHHFMTPRSVEETRDRFMVEVTGMERPQSAILEWTVEKSLAEMDKAGVETAMLSLNSPGLFAKTQGGNRALARHVNEYAARVQADYPGRFGHFASLPLADTEGALREVAHALDALKADGFVVRTSDEDRWHGDPSYWPVYEELNRRKAVLFVHPASALCCQKMNVAHPPALIEYPFDTTRAIMNWIFSGAAAKFPDSRLIYKHGGGSTLMVQDRLEAVARIRPDLGERLPQGKDVMEVIRSHFYDTALVYNKTAFAAMREGLPLSQILYGSDVPYRQMGPEVAALRQLVSSAEEFRAIERDNAVALFPRLG